jgi:hypothetical protein
MCLNMSNNDLAVNLHFALFNTSAGYLLKPPGMCASNVDADSPTGTRDLDDSYWPPARDVLQRTVIEIISLHSCPKVCGASVRPWSYQHFCLPTLR